MKKVVGLFLAVLTVLHGGTRVYSSSFITSTCIGKLMPMDAATVMWSSSIPMLILPPPTSTKNILLVSTATTTPIPTSQNEITNIPTRVARNETSYMPTPTRTQLIATPGETVNSSSRGPLWVWAFLLVTVTFIMSVTGILIIIAALKCRHRTGSYNLNDTARHPTEENRCDSETDTCRKKSYSSRPSSNRSSSTSSSKRTGIFSPRFGLAGNRTRSSLSLNIVRGGFLRGSRQSLSSLRSHGLVDMKLNLVYSPPVSCPMFKDPPPLTQETTVNQDSSSVAMQDVSHSENQLEQQEILESRSTLSGHESECGSSCSGSNSSDITLHMYPV